ncbi:hypothetical protein FRC04_001708 [Tulasnella sp. 424]|nr:hypothetical protein FRC04_001708 [Tulasnella sp. 424]KAG8975442.1 hypothetical protein FRC05_005772 [Tulasnella sp. 425]
MSKVVEVELPQHVLDARFFQGLAERLLPPDPPEDEEESIIEKVGEELEVAASINSYDCDCDPDKYGRGGFGEDSDKDDGWFCLVRDIEDDYKTHVVLDRVRSAIEIDPNRGDFPEDIYQEICERYSIEQAKLLETQEQTEDSSDDQEQTSPHSPPRPCVFPPFSLQHLPPEVLTEIALAAQAFDPHVHITLSHVDASLRAFVKSTPLLWTRVDFLYPLHLVHLYFDRSADVPLRVTMLLPLQNSPHDCPFLNDVEPTENKRMKQFMRALYPHRYRVLSLRLRCEHLLFEVSAENEGQIPAAEFLWDGSMVKLELLDLELRNWGLMSKPVPSSNGVIDLRLHGPWNALVFPLFSSRLKSLTIADHEPSFTKVFNALQAAPCLVSLTLRDMSLAGRREREGSLVTLNQLESLSFIRVYSDVVQALFSCITAPNLVSIALQFADTFPFIPRLPLFPTPQPSVQRLDLTNCEGGPSKLASVLRTFPGITHLRIASSNLYDRHLLPLIVKPSPFGEPDITETACPNLKHLTIDNEFNPITGVIRLTAFSRHSAGIPLESVTLRDIPMDDAAYNDIRRLGDIVPKLDIRGFDQELDVYGDSDAFSVSETSSEGDWASGDEEIVIACRNVREPSPGRLLPGYLILSTKYLDPGVF